MRPGCGQASGRLFLVVRPVSHTTRDHRKGHKMSQDIAKRTPIINEDALRNIGTFDDFVKFTKDNDILVENIAMYGSGVVVLADKSRLIASPFVITGYAFHAGDKGEFVSLTCVTRDPVRIGETTHSKVVINDGSTGIMAQLKRIEAERIENGQEIRPLYCGGGLRVSVYDYTDENTGETSSASTYYLA